MATAGTLINGAGLTFFGGGTALANVLSAGAVSSAIGLGLAAFAATRPQEDEGYGYEEEGYHRRRGLNRQGARSGAKRRGKLRETYASDGVSEGRSSNLGRPKFARPGKNGGLRSAGAVGRQAKTIGDIEGNSGGSRPVKIIAGKLGTKVGSQTKTRSKREQKAIDLGPLAVLQYEEKLELQETLELIRQHDTAGCGKRLMCELGGMNQEELTIEELSILNLVRPSSSDVRGSSAEGNQASLEYLEAKTRGQKGEKCGQVYPRCTLDGKQLMSIVMEYLP